ncbi:MAG: sigma-70 family RNA polymerase sigma factor [Polyangiaceae bacterium]|nr:sigma-70 family RNA polymerase sigma factor [Polyangiaceae bacterium]
MSDPVHLSQAATTQRIERLDLRSLFERHYASMWRLLRRLGVPSAELDDTAQEVFWVAARRLEDIAPGREHAFLYGVALRIAANHLRREAAAPRVELALDRPLVDDSPSPEDRVELRQERALLDRVLEQMPLELRRVFVLFELESLEVRQIAELEHIPVGTASSRLRRAREEFSSIAKRVRASLKARGGRW